MNEMAWNAFLDLLAAGERGDLDEFARRVGAMDWTQQHAWNLADTIDMALRLHMPTLARVLALKGQMLFPGHEVLQREGTRDASGREGAHG